MRSNTEPYVDLHCHFLPEMDDGCRTVEEPVKLLEEQWRQGCTGIASTSHYYASESIEEFLARREASAAKLRKTLEKEQPEYLDRIEAPVWLFIPFLKRASAENLPLMKQSVFVSKSWRNYLINLAEEN